MSGTFNTARSDARQARVPIPTGCRMLHALLVATSRMWTRRRWHIPGCRSSPTSRSSTSIRRNQLRARRPRRDSARNSPMRVSSTNMRAASRSASLSERIAVIGCRREVEQLQASSIPRWRSFSTTRTILLRPKPTWSPVPTTRSTFLRRGRRASPHADPRATLKRSAACRIIPLSIPVDDDDRSAQAVPKSAVSMY